MGRLGAADVAEGLKMPNLAATVRKLHRMTGATASTSGLELDGIGRDWIIG